MADHPRFGPAGVPPLFKVMNAKLEDVPRLLKEEGLDAFEYQAVRWGKKPQVKKEEAEKLGASAKANDVWLSMHGSYYTNFCGRKEIVEASKQRLIACATAAQCMNAHVIVFHPGFYGKKPKSEALRNCAEALKQTISEMAASSVKGVRVGLETMGKRSQVGTLEEVLTLCEQVEGIQPVIDWSHLYARSMGQLRSADDFREIISKIENRLGTESAKNLHCHFTKVEFTLKGERRHHTLDEKGYGPDFRMLAKVILEFDLRPVVISESPIQDIDSMKMRELLQNELKL